MIFESVRTDLNISRNKSIIFKRHFVKKRSVLATSILCLTIFILLSGNSFSSVNIPADTDTHQLKSKHNFEISVVSNYYKYSEPNGIDIDISGFMTGFMGKYIYYASSGFIFSIELEYTDGINTEYDGATWGGTPLKADSNDWIFESRLIVGNRLKLYKHFIINPYLGLGARYWHNDIDSPESYKRKTEYLYIPIGTFFSYKVSENFKWKFVFEFDIFLRGRNKSYLSDANSDFNDLEFDQYSGHGLRASLPIIYKSLQIEPYIYYWNIGNSSMDLLTNNGLPYKYIIEPANKTTVCGIRLSFIF